MSSFGVPPRRPVTEQKLWRQSVLKTFEHASFTPETPELLTRRELDQRVRFTPEEDPSFGTKFYNAFAEETLTGQWMGSLNDPKFIDTGYYPSDEDKQTYASDLPEETVERVASETNSFEEFLFQLDEVRLTRKRREELFAGGALGYATGFGLTMIASGGEATLLSLGAAALMPASAPAATTATAMQVAAAARRATRIRAILKAAGASAVLDVPIEATRYQLDKSLTTTDLLVNLGASVALAGGVGALFPEKFVGNILNSADEAAIREAAEFADPKTKAKLEKILKLRVKVRQMLNSDDPAEVVAAMNDKELRAEAKKYGIKVRDSYYETETVINPKTGEEEKVYVKRAYDEDGKPLKRVPEDSEPVSYTVQRKPRKEAKPRDLEAEEEDLLARVDEEVEAEMGEFNADDLADEDLLDELDQADPAATRDNAVRKLARAEDEQAALSKKAKEDIDDLEVSAVKAEERLAALEKIQRDNAKDLEDSIAEETVLRRLLARAEAGEDVAVSAQKGKFTKEQLIAEIKDRLRILRKNTQRIEDEMEGLFDRIKQAEAEAQVYRGYKESYVQGNFREGDEGGGAYTGTELDNYHLDPELRKDYAADRLKEVRRDVNEDISTDINVIRQKESDPYTIVRVIDKLRADPDTDPFAVLDKARRKKKPRKEGLRSEKEIEEQAGKENDLGSLEAILNAESLERYYKSAKRNIEKIEVERTRRTRKRRLTAKRAKRQFEARKKELRAEVETKLRKAKSKNERRRVLREFNRNLNKLAEGEDVTTVIVDASAEASKIRYRRVRRQPYRDIEKVREELIEAKRLEGERIAGATEEAIEKQVSKKWERMGTIGDGESARRRYAQILGVTGGVLKKGGAALKKATIEAAKVAAKRGFAITGGIGKPKGVRFSGTAMVGKVKYRLAGNTEQMLWKLATARGDKAGKTKKAIRDYLKQHGVEDPDKLASDFANRVRSDVKARNERFAKRQAKRQESGQEGPTRPEKEYIADLAEMELDSARRMRDGVPYKPEKGEPLFGNPREVNFRVDREMFGDLEGDEALKKAVDENTIEGTNYKKDEIPEGDDATDLADKPASDVEEAVVTSDRGEPVATGPKEDAEAAERFVEIGDDYVTPEKGGKSSHSDGLRDRLEGSVSSFGLRGIPIFGKMFYQLFTPVVQRFLNSSSPLLRRFATIFHDNPVGKGPASIVSIARLNFERQTGWLQQQLAIAGEAARRQGVRLTDRELIRAVRSGDTPDGPAGVAVKAIRTYYKRLLDYAKKEGLDVENIPDDPAYFSRSWSPVAYRNLIEKFGGFEGGGAAKVHKFLAQAIKNKTPKLTDKQANALAERIGDYLRNPEAKRDLNKSITTLDSLKKKLVEELEDIQDDALAEAGGITGLAEDLIGIIGHKHTDQPNLSLGRRRIALDELFEGEIDGVRVHIDEMMDMDINLITRRYAQEVIGGVSVSKGFKLVFGDKVKTIGDVKKQLREASENAGDAAYETKMYERMVDVTYKTLTGQKIYSKNIMKIAVANNMFAQATMGMTLGFAQIPEIANVVARSGFRAAYQQFNLRDMISTFGMGFRKSRKRSEIDEFSSCLEAWTGIGGDYSRGDHFMRRMDDIGFDDADFTSSRIGKFFDAGRLVSVLNPMGVMPMDTFMRRWAARASFQHFVNKAYDVGADGVITLSRGWWKNNKTRFAQLGFDEADINRLAKVLRNTDLVKYERGMFGGYKVKSFDFTKADDQEILDKFVMALRRNTDSMIQRQTFSEMPAWMNSDFGKLISQFRVFSVVAKSKQLAAGIARGDAVEAINVVGGGGLALMGYMMQTYYRSMSQPDPEKYYKEKTSDPEKLFTYAISRTGYSSIFPSLIDLGSKTITGEGLFDPSARTTGQTLHPIKGSTGWSNSEKIVQAADTLLGGLFRGKEMTQQDVRGLAGLVWLFKMPGVEQAISQNFINQFPER